ncbi:MAG: ABC transporter ATP-binding protein [Paracoccaceae bacterium]|jgi:branched-chain amino acid transport system ATP-binding protein|nr:ABC transporter ATP-binding protein [Paracoccaceae bacterium]MDG1371407.1 ABC transporter ATP-binding protein [Paracoccaceae bacterium]MDG1970781.1 ABC transporter ATP-binding protein [Paracoccaceae bacterium]
MSFLSLKNVTASYGATQALFGVDLSLEEGEFLALMGRNGMGKSTTIKIICRMMKHQDGEVNFAGRDMRGLPSHKAARLGVGLVPEGRRCFPNLTVEENLTAAARTGEWTLDRIFDFLPRLRERREQSAATLSGGEQQMLAIGRALMTNPKLLLLDEATEGLAPNIRTEIWAMIGQLKATGLSIIAVDKSLKELRGVADNCVILERGATAWTGSAGDLDDATASRLLGV